MNDVQARRRSAVVCAAVGVFLLIGVLTLPVPFASESPGPVLNVLGATNGPSATTSTPEASGTSSRTATAREKAAASSRLITISGRRTYPTSGALDLVTVSEAGGPDGALSLPEVVAGWLQPTTSVVPVGVLFPPGTSATATHRQDRAEMDSSQQDASAAALYALGIPVPTTIRVEGTVASGGAAHLLKAGDVITGIDGHAIADLPALHAQLQAASGPSVEVAVRRGSADEQVSVPLIRSGGSVALGVYVDPDYHFPFTVTIAVDRIGGPSAGMMFALGIIDELTPGALTGGQHIAGTGTIDPTGQVGAIGGIAQKMAGAAAAGATVFLAPASNCADVTGHVPKGLRVVKVSTLTQARAAVEAVADGRGASLVGCPQ